MRGLRKKEWVDDDDVISFEAFLPDPSTAKSREDQGEETSINWEDDAAVEALTLAEPNAANGAARLNKSAVEYVRTRQLVFHRLFAERRIVGKNVHHGNIVFTGLKTRLKKMAATTLALEVLSVAKQPSTPK